MNSDNDNITGYTVVKFLSCNNNTTDATIGAGHIYPSDAHGHTPILCGVCAAPSLVFCLMFCRSLIVLFLLDIVLSVLL